MLVKDEQDVDKIGFTGSTATGKKVMATCAENLTPVLMECGGKDALIVGADADLVAYDPDAERADANTFTAMAADHGSVQSSQYDVSTRAGYAAAWWQKRQG